MVFSSAVFLLYFLPAFLLLYFLFPSSRKNALLLFASLFFYAWGAPVFVFVLIASSVIDHFIAHKLHSIENVQSRKHWLTLGIVLNVGLLIYFKYFNFFVDNINDILGVMGVDALSYTKVLLPIGISFFTFQKLSFLVDCYRGDAMPMKKFSNYLLFVCLFPQLIAGPIVRFKEIASQIEGSRAFHGLEPVFDGAFRFIVGLAKKVLVANTLGQTADHIFALPESELSFYISWIGILAYSFQIYFDFSGYSDMAIGICKMAGYRIPENFNYPYISQSITEFWRRWHMSLSRWMKDYLYIPLGGNRVSRSRLFFNLWLVFLISGLWHGASWNFVIWGSIHGLFLVLERMIGPQKLSGGVAILRIALNFFIVTVAWVFFRLENFDTAMGYLSNMLIPDPSTKYLNMVPEKFIFVMFVAILFSFIPLNKRVKEFLSGGNILFRGSLAILLLILSLAEILAGGFNPFIYFRF